MLPLLTLPLEPLEPVELVEPVLPAEPTEPTEPEVPAEPTVLVLPEPPTEPLVAPLAVVVVDPAVPLLTVAVVPLLPVDELAAVARDPEPLVLPAIEPLVAPDDFPVDFEPALVDLDPVEVAELFPEEPLPDDEAPALPDEPLVEPLEVELELEAAAELLPVVVEDDFPPVDEARLLAATALPLLAELPRVPEPAVRDPELPLLLAVDPDEAPVDVPTDPELAAAWLPEAVALERVTTPVVDPLVDAPVEPELP